MPTTRYQGSKRKLLPDLEVVFAGLKFQTCLDAFGGTGSVSHLLRGMGKTVQYNDILPSNAIMAKALFANRPIVTHVRDVERVFIVKPEKTYRANISECYRGIYFTDDENRQLDVVLQNIGDIMDETARVELLYCLFQSAISKRPYNLFHRANLDMRLKEVDRSFGNKATWDKPFLAHMKKFHRELEIYRSEIYDNISHVSCVSAFDLGGKFDLVYIDTPYAKSDKAQESNYFNFYHFLDAMVDYDHIPERVLSNYAHRPIYEPNTIWYKQQTINEAFRALFRHYQISQLVISYRSDGYPSPDELIANLHELYGSVELIHLAKYKYVLSTQKTDTKEIVIIAR